MSNSEQFNPSYESSKIDEEVTAIFSPANRLRRSPIQTRSITKNQDQQASTNTSEEGQKKPIPRQKISTSTQTVHSVNEENMDITIQEALAASKTPQVPKFVSPSIFNPAISNVASFINNYERCAAVNCWDDTYKIAYFNTFLEAPANNWYQKYISKPQNANKSWADMKAEFILEFGGEAALRKAKFRFNTRKQMEGEDIKSYFYGLQQLAEEVDPDMHITTFRDHFENGLHPSFYEAYYLLAPTNMTMSDLRNIVYRLSDVKDRMLIAQMSHPSLIALPQRVEVTQQATNRNSQDRGYPRTRSPDGRPYCPICKIRGHYPSRCWYREDRRNSSSWNQQNRRFNQLSNREQRNPNTRRNTSRSSPQHFTSDRRRRDDQPANDEHHRTQPNNSNPNAERRH